MHVIETPKFGLKGICLLYDNASAHKSRVLVVFLNSQASLNRDFFGEPGTLSYWGKHKMLLKARHQEQEKIALRV